MPRISRKLRRLALLAPLAVSGSIAGGAVAPLTVNTAHAGWYTESGRHDAGNGNYLAGECCGGPMAHAVQPEHRGFFVFDLTHLAGSEPITEATLRLPTYAYHSADATELLAFFDVGIKVKPLTRTRVSRKAFRDLGDGAIYGTQTYSAADSGREMVVPLTEDFVAAANAARGGMLAVGSRVVTLDPSHDTEEYVFGIASRDVPGPQLTLGIGQADIGVPSDGGGGDPDPVEPGPVDPGPIDPPSPGPAVPLPAAVWMGLVGLAAVAFGRKALNIPHGRA